MSSSSPADGQAPGSHPRAVDDLGGSGGLPAESVYETRSKA